jgi:glycosyltransferase involved in cell wall biosynthesis
MPGPSSEVTRDRARPRVAIVVSHPIQHFCPQYASFAKSEDFEIRVFFGSSSGARPYEDKNFGLTIRWEALDLDGFPHEFLNDEAIPPSANLDAPNLDERLRAFDPQAVLLYGYNQRLSRRALRAGQRLGARILMFSDGELRQRRSLAVRVAKRLLLPRYLRSVGAFLTTGDANDEYYRHYGVPAGRLIRAPYPIDRARYERARVTAADDRAKIRRELGVPDDSLLCLVVGKLVDWKRQGDVVAMLSQPGMEGARVVLIGTGRDEQRLRQQAERVAPDRVRFAGFVQPVDLPRYYAACDVYIHPSEREPHSVAVSEAVFMGCPIVISDRCGSYGSTDDVQPGRNGFVYRCGDVTGLVMAVRRLGANGVLRKRFAAASRTIGTHNQMLSHGDGLVSALACVGLI